MKTRLTILGMGCALLASAHAATVTVSPSMTAVSAGGEVTIDLSVSLEAAEILAGFDIDILYDDNLFAMTGWSFVDEASGSNQLDLPEAGSFGFFGDALASAGVVDVFGVSGNSDAALAAGQADEFLFLQLTFQAIAAAGSGSFLLDLSDPLLAFLGADFSDLSLNFASNSARVSIGDAEVVPLPGAAFLLGPVLAGLGLSRARRERS